MAEVSRILVGVDFSPCSRYAAEYAGALARRLGAAVHLAHVVDTAYLSYAAMYGQTVVIDPNIESVEQAAEEGLEKTAETLRGTGLDVTAHLQQGNPVDVLLSIADKAGCELIVTGTHGYRGLNKFLFGSTCERIVRRSPIPVLAVRQPEGQEHFDDASFAIERVLFPTDFSEFSKKALPAAVALCEATGAELLILHVVDTRYDSFPFLAAVDQPEHAQIVAHSESEAIALAAGVSDVTVSTRVVDGVPHERIEQAVLDDNVDLLVMATHGHGAVLHALLGSTAEKVVRLAQCPVMTVRPG